MKQSDGPKLLLRKEGGEWLLDSAMVLSLALCDSNARIWWCRKPRVSTVH